MSKEIKTIDEEHIAVISTHTSEQLIAKPTLVARKVALLEQVAEVDEMLELFVAK